MAGTAGTATTKSAVILNFDEITCEIVTVVKRGRRFDLRDDVPMEVLVGAFGMADLGARLKEARDEAMQAADGNGGDLSEASQSLRASFAEIAEETVPLCTDIFKHSYPDVSEDEIADLFSFEERMQLIRLFFTRRLSMLNAQPDGISDDMAEVLKAAQAAQQEQAEPVPNRAMRRATRGTTASRPSRLATTPRLPR